MNKDASGEPRSRDAFRVVNAKPRKFRAPRVPERPKDIANQLMWAADGVDEIGLGEDGLRGGSALLRAAAAEITRLRALEATTPPPGDVVERVARAIYGVFDIQDGLDVQAAEKYATAALDALAVDRWQPIESAPKDGTPILLAINPIDEGYLLGWNPAREIKMVIGWWGYSEWTSHLMEEGTADTEGHSSPYQITIRPTHWMPLPPPPLKEHP